MELGMHAACDMTEGLPDDDEKIPTGRMSDHVSMIVEGGRQVMREQHLQKDCEFDSLSSQNREEYRRILEAGRLWAQATVVQPEGSTKNFTVDRFGMCSFEGEVESGHPEYYSDESGSRSDIEGETEGSQRLL
ncbi:hypothetical protein ACFCXT_09585 [Streptomyces vinaceus]|uniref:hypothetical protein n=1 Tax=Streptomyces vinaceus TaxID=1960 RepID=UPI0035D880E4